MITKKQKKKKKNETLKFYYFFITFWFYSYFNGLSNHFRHPLSISLSLSLAFIVTYILWVTSLRWIESNCFISSYNIRKGFDSIANHPISSWKIKFLIAAHSICDFSNHRMLWLNVFMKCFRSMRYYNLQSACIMRSLTLTRNTQHINRGPSSSSSSPFLIIIHRGFDEQQKESEKNITFIYNNINPK